MQAALAIGGLIVLAIVLGTLRRTLINSLGSKAVAASRGNKPKSKLQKFFGW
ncbi:MAG TPA: hypothetical protein VKQ30_15120 [Ktedonobacterales bacterium]|nr:hypothetical protein [Ktedonobacterales bacterium]